MTKRRPVVEKRGLFRRNPEQILIADEEAQAGRHAGSLAAERKSPEELALLAAIDAFGEAHGWPTAACWLAARARRIDAGPDIEAPRAVAETAFRRRVA